MFTSLFFHQWQCFFAPCITTHNPQSLYSLRRTANFRNISFVFSEFTRCMSQVGVTSQVPISFSSFFLVFLFFSRFCLDGCHCDWGFHNDVCPKYYKHGIFFRVRHDRETSFAGSSTLNEIIPILPEQTRSFQDPRNNFCFKTQEERERKKEMRYYLNIFALIWKSNMASTFCPRGNRIDCVLSWVLCGRNKMTQWRKR